MISKGLPLCSFVSRVFDFYVIELQFSKLTPLKWRLYEGEDKSWTITPAGKESRPST